MQPVRIKHTIEKLASHGGLILIGDLLNSMNMQKSFNQINVHCVDPKFSHADILSSMIGLLSIAKPDYDAINIFYEKQDFFAKALQISDCPSSPTLRQRIDLIGNSLGMLVYNMLRVIEQISLEEMSKGPFPKYRRKGVTRRRIKTVIQDLMYMAGRLIHTGRVWYFSFGQLNPFAGICERIINRIRGVPAMA